MSASQRSDQTANPVLVELYHGAHAESAHRGVAAIANARGEIIWSVGEIERLTCIRSALKPLQALALLQTGAFESLTLQDEHLAIASGSHSGEPRHVGLVAQWLSQLGLSRTDLRCGCSRPLDSEAHRKLIHDHTAATELHHNCSGKHAGFLAISSHLGADIKTYSEPDHPVQRQVLSSLEMQLDHTISSSNINVDGCSAPNIFAPFQIFASAFGRFVDQGSSDSTALQRQHILVAMAKYPELVSGANRLSAALNQASGGKVIGKSGAEGSYLAMVPSKGIAILLKVDDGAKRAAHTAILAILSELDLLSTRTADELWPGFSSSRGDAIGQFKTTSAFDALTPDLIGNGR